MKRICLLAVLALTVSCGLGRGKVMTWMDGKTEAPALSVAGNWSSPNSYFNGGWGNGIWFQSGARVTGNLGPYGIEGKVAGKRLYLMILNGSKPAYTAILEQGKDGRLEGLAYSEAIADAPGSSGSQTYPVVLVQAQN